MPVKLVLRSEYTVRLGGPKGRIHKMYVVKRQIKNNYNYAVLEMFDGQVRSTLSRHKTRAEALAHVNDYEAEDREDDPRVRQAMGWR